MSLRLRKSVNLGGGFRVNLSKSGVGSSWGTKGFRITKTSDGKTRKTYSIPGTGISYVDEKGKSSYAHNDGGNGFEYNSKTDDSIKEMSIMKNILKVILSILLFLLLFIYFTPGLILGAITIIIYYIFHRQNFMKKSLFKKIGICILIFFLIIAGTV